MGCATLSSLFFSNNKKENLGHKQNSDCFGHAGMYVDFIKWAVINIPGLRSVDIRSLVGDTLRICAYVYNPSQIKGITGCLHFLLLTFTCDLGLQLFCLCLSPEGVLKGTFDHFHVFLIFLNRCGQVLISGYRPDFGT